MVYNCFINLQPADYDLISNCLPTLAEHLKESEPRCVERVCSCFVRLISAYRFEPNLLKCIVNSCNLLTNLQSLVRVYVFLCVSFFYICNCVCFNKKICHPLAFVIDLSVLK